MVAMKSSMMNRLGWAREVRVSAEAEVLPTIVSWVYRVKLSRDTMKGESAAGYQVGVIEIRSIFDASARSSASLIGRMSKGELMS
jgi:hypothetical protein